MIHRRSLLAAAATLPAAIAKAASIDAHVRTGTIKDVEHVVILCQENRSFDHYFGAMAGVRGFADRFPIPLSGGGTVWSQANAQMAGRPKTIAPFPLNTRQTFAHMRVEGTPHNWPDAQAAWDQGRMGGWPAVKGEHAMGYYGAEDIPFQYALADAFTLCDAYHCSIQTGTNSNRLFLWTGANDPAGAHGGPSITNSHDRFAEQGGAAEGYGWTTYLERLQAAGISWRVYQDMADNFTDNPLAGFKSFRDAHKGVAGSDPRLAAEGLSTLKLDRLRADVLAGTLPQVCHIVAPAAACEHPGPSSPAQGADFTAQVLEALTANPAVWAKTVLFLTYDENDGFFDHMPPPSPPSKDANGALLGGSTVDTAGEYHMVKAPSEAPADRPELMGRPYGLGPRVPMHVISPWSRGGYVSSEVFDHTSVIRFLEQRFGVKEPAISPWRRSVCGDLTSTFNFKSPNAAAAALPATAVESSRAAALPGRTKPPTPAQSVAPTQGAAVRPSRATPYNLEAAATVTASAVRVTFTNRGRAGAVFHVYDRLNLAVPPRRFTVGAGASLVGDWSGGAYDLWVLGPGGFHRHVRGEGGAGLEVRAQPSRGRLTLLVTHPGTAPARLVLAANAYGPAGASTPVSAAPGINTISTDMLTGPGGWYDVSLTDPTRPGWLRRFAGRIETGRDSISDPAMGGAAVMAWTG